MCTEDPLFLHGPTSSFRDLSSQHAAFPSSASIPDVHLTAFERAAKLREWALQLFANAAPERQKEHTYLSLPTFELDGVGHHSAFTLLNYYWNHQSDACIMVYRPAVMHSLATGGVYANKLLLNALYYAGALLSGHERFMDDASKPNTLGNRFFHRFQSLLAHFEVSLIDTISTLVVTSSALLTRGKQTLAYLYFGLAQRMMTDLGFHVNPDMVNHASYSPYLPIYSML
ncbi:hypothetical protein LTS07_009373 [Exophiala sideris]|uniref:Xylanolytic transcriptional activator regulatory domain-containing protein n=1 Tax=Exophiala sideris TaxID=1016849 RepID=A0ABR0IZB1_9EURO|nr:hypothetical protein LTS07_009373 [Exophiala sideris]KAK5028126.1 hypothetical protein LTR13_009114 [Exophiala sideris]KAK5052784.1 hypothetical protein LTR69_009610 [Exophiala sideris]KAK5178395.1 hypothetical protein LTR44_009020 [Eurotiomycetes sp. CCFEE 6388]